MTYICSCRSRMVSKLDEAHVVVVGGNLALQRQHVKLLQHAKCATRRRLCHRGGE